MTTLTMSTVRANLIAKGMLKPDAVAVPSTDTRHGRASNLKAVAARKQELGYWPTIVRKQKRVYQLPSKAQ